jgi:hypothetical protein
LILPVIVRFTYYVMEFERLQYVFEKKFMNAESMECHASML